MSTAVPPTNSNEVLLADPGCCCTSVRKSRHLVVFILFLAVLMDVMLMTSIDPVIPDVVHSIEGDAMPDKSEILQNDFAANETPEDIYEREDETSDDTFEETEEQWQQELRTFFNTSDDQNDASDIDSTIQPDAFQDGEPVNTTLLRNSRGTEIGVIVGAKPLGELFCNLVVGCIVDRVGHKYPMLLGFLVNFVATAGFAYGESFLFLVMARILQAVGSSLSVVSGLVFLASVFPDDAERAKANSRAFFGISVGVILGYPFGSTTYQFAGKRSPFLILGVVNLLAFFLRLWLVTPKEHKLKDNCTSLRGFGRLLKDPYILVGLGCSFISNFGLGIFLGTGPAWMRYILHAEQWTIGVVLAAAVVFHLFAQFITGIYSVALGRWLFLMFGLIVSGIGMILYPICPNIWWVLGPEITVRLGQGTVLAVISPLLGYISDIRHNSNYGSVYGLYTTSYNLGLSVGPIAGGSLVKLLTFDWLYRGTGALIILFSSLSVVFRRPKPRPYSPLLKVKQEYNTYGSIQNSPDEENKSENNHSSGEDSYREAQPEYLDPSEP